MDDRLRQLQLAELEILDEFIRICNMHSLQYYLVGGSLLGAVRHQGFIPWDDDIDVALPWKDYLELLSLQHDFAPDYRLDSEELDADCPFNYCKLYHRAVVFDPLPEYGPSEIYIDIYPILPSRFPGMAARLCMNLICVIGYALQVKCGWDEYVPYKKRAAVYAYSFFQRLPVESLRRLRRKLTRWLTSEGTGYCFSPGGKYGEKEIYPALWYTNLKMAVFEGRICPVLEEWDAYLRRLFGDYEILPEKTERTPKHGACLKAAE